MSGRHAVPKKRKKEYEDDDFAKAAGRFITAMGRRASENPEALAFMIGLGKVMKDETDRAAAALHADAGFSLGEIAKFLTDFGHPMTRQNAQKRWGPTSIARKMAPTQVANVINLAKVRAQKARAEVWGKTDAEVVQFKERTAG
ncbi:hypothetical protein [Streptomyces sp. ISL-100]|uniref:hypothetical protein n=1 Tax=Streptomyces sp. ISL-100 TaxID=2819173 RepID=UPI001BE7A5D6|nr:hypothetical protein [Streptomyces sp. ISL-100]MBT2400630.1 hypothetical protein [Streptomyces sp. ISL-100]